MSPRDGLLAVGEPAANDDPTVQVVVRDVRMRFGSMVIFMVKWAIAAIPALVILTFLFVAVSLFATALVGSMVGLSHIGGKASTSSMPTGAAKSMDPARAAYLERVIVQNVRVGQSVLDEPGVWGEIKNAGDRALKEVDITIFCLGADGKPVFEQKFYPVLVPADGSLGLGDESEPLKAGYSRKFGVKLDDAPSDWTKQVEVKVTDIEFQ